MFRNPLHGWTSEGLAWPQALINVKVLAGHSQLHYGNPIKCYLHVFKSCISMFLLAERAFVKDKQVRLEVPNVKTPSKPGPKGKKLPKPVYFNFFI